MWASIHTLKTVDTFGVAEFFPWQIQNADTHGADFNTEAAFTFCAFN